MRIISEIFLFILFLSFFSCAEKTQFPEKKSGKFPATSVILNQNIFEFQSSVSDSLSEPVISNEMERLKKFVSDYENHRENFSLEKMKLLWESENKKNDFNLRFDITDWIEVTGFLLEITGKPVYAEALEKLSKAEILSFSDSTIEAAANQLTPYIFTKNIDHVFVNLFVNSSVEYVHSLGGKVKITQVTEDSVTVVLKFNMEEKRYIELNILIPSWAKNATVTEKNVKYVATPGEYSFIARKWGEGDFVEVNF